LFDKKKEKLFFTVFFSSAKNSCFITSAPLAREQKTVETVFYFIGHEVLFYETPFYTAIEETRSVGSQKKSAVVAGRVLNLGTKEGTTSFEPIERPITCVSSLYNARQAS
jgi:hypothetical protein